MKTINGKSKLNRLIKEILWEVPEYPFDFPYSVLYQEGPLSSTFRFTIEKIELDYFIDDKGQKWIKAPANPEENI